MNSRPLQATMALIRRWMAEGAALSARDIAERSGVNVRNIRPYLAFLHEAKEIRIVDWRNAGQGPWAPVYARREDEDEQDVPKNNVERRRRLRAARDRARKVLANPYELLRLK